VASNDPAAADGPAECIVPIGHIDDEALFNVID
jgi:hypothetical protein